MTKKTILQALLMLGFMAAGCSSNPVAHERSTLPRSLTDQELQLIESDNLFGLKLFRTINAAEGDTNIIISPLSVSMALGMTLNGAGGETYTAMQETLELIGLTEEEINQAYQSLTELLINLDPKVIFQIANSIWYRDTFNIAAPFVDVNQLYFDAEVAGLDFSSPSAPDIINGWVEEKTNGRIDEIIDRPIHPLTVMFLINAIYFKADWTFQFDPNDTVEQPFTLPDESTKQVQMMTMKEVTLPCYHGERYQAIDLAYGDSLFSMTIILPHPDEDLDSFIAGLDRAAWESALGSLYHQELSLFQMPKFSLEYAIKLNEVLQSLGMEIAFDENLADFLRMRDGPGENIYISEVKHKTFIEVDERGTEAAAVTSVEMRERGISEDYIVLDHPFIFAIRERFSGTILFIGKIVDPAP